MKFRPWIAILSSLTLASGCAASTSEFCAIARPIYIGGNDVVDWLAENDEILLQDIVIHNETVETCP
jgi:hypothetical protein